MRAPADDRRAPLRAELAVALGFFGSGCVGGTTATRIPALQSALGLPLPSLGAALGFSAIGALIAAPTAGLLVNRWGSVAVFRVASVTFPLSMFSLFTVNSLLALSAIAACSGASAAAINVANNAQALALEQRDGRLLLSRLHGAYGVGAITGAALGSFSLYIGVPTRLHTGAVAVALLVCSILVSRSLLSTKRPSPASDVGAFVSGSVLLICFSAFLGALAEGSALNWAALYVHRFAGGTIAVAGVAVTCFWMAMTFGRLCGGRLEQSLGTQRFIQISSGVASLGCVLGLVSGGWPGALVGFGVYGLGLSCVVPLLYREVSKNLSSGHGIALVATGAGFGALASWGLIGSVAGAVGLRGALVATTGSVALIGCAAAVFCAAPQNQATSNAAAA